MMPLQIRDDLHKIDKTCFDYIYEENATVALKASNGLVRCNVYRPRDKSTKWPVLVTYGPYVKDIPYKSFAPKSFVEMNPEHRSHHSAWETPDPDYWTRHGYVVVRADERGLGQLTGLLDTMSRGTSDAFYDVVEWASEQEWSSGKVGLLGISYYAGSQWRVAARQPKGLCCIVPWEGMSDYYRDRCRHGGILSNAFIRFWWVRQVVCNQYGKAHRPAKDWGPDTLEGNLGEEELIQNRVDQNEDNSQYQFRNQPYYASKEYNMADIQVPLLSVANWGGILLHLRGNVEGYVNSGSHLKYLRFITGRHDLPFYYHDEVELQRSFLDAFLKGDDRVGWSVPGKVAPVDLVLRKGDVGYNDPQGEKRFQRRTEQEWPLARTQYTPYYLTADHALVLEKSMAAASNTKLTYEALGNIDDPQLIHFTTAVFDSETEITGHVVAHLNVSVSPHAEGPTTSDIDLFITLRHLSPEGNEIAYTGTAGDPVPLCKGWLRGSLRKTNSDHVRHRSWLPYRDYFSTDELPIIPGEVYPVDIEVWPTNAIMEKGDRLVFEVASGDTQGCGTFQHNPSEDRPHDKFAGKNHIHFGSKFPNFVTLPIIPPRE